LAAVVDRDEEKARRSADKYGAPALTDHTELLGRVDAVSVAVPTASHYDVARDFLQAGADVLVEKPVTPDEASARSLIEIARENDRILQVGHLERFSGVVEALRALQVRPLYIDSVRISPYKARSTDINVILDMMIHDLDLILFLVDAPIVTVDAAGAAVFSEHEDIASVRIRFANGCIANVVASRISLKTERKMRLFEPERYVTVDMDKRRISTVAKSESGIPVGSAHVALAEESYDEGDALEREIAAFVQSVRTRRPAAVSGEDGLNALTAAIQINESLQAHAACLGQVADAASAR
jgi:predicted dehydrogenase